VNLATIRVFDAYTQIFDKAEDGQSVHIEKLYNLSNLEEINGGSEDFILQMIILFLDQAATSISGLEKDFD